MNNEKQKKKISFTSINIPYPKNCSECKLYNKHQDYPTCYGSNLAIGYNKFDIFTKKMLNCPLNQITIEYE